MILRRHPRKLELGAWFDGEGSDRVGSHVMGCSRCQRHVTELSRLRSWLRAQPFVAMGETPEPAEPGSKRHPVLVVAALLATFLVVAERDEAPSPVRTASPTTTTTAAAPAGPSTTGEVPAGAAGEPSAGAELALPPASSVPASPAADSVAGQAIARAKQPAASASPLRLGLIVPSTGAMAAEGAEVTDVVRKRVGAANAAGGVAGLPVELEIAAAENADAVAKLVDRVDVLVGGFGVAAPTGTPWLLPADPSIAGPSVVPAEMTSRLAGSQLGAVLRRQGINGPVGVVVGSGPDSALATGLASRTTTTVVQAQEAGTCVAEVTALRRAGAVALAVAGAPDLAAKCMRAAFRITWLPPFGTILAPSAAYAGLHAMPEALGARTVLGLPWPTSTAPGAARFRATTQSTSYRALVSYAATELAIDVARQKGGVSLDSVETGSWRSDLFDLVGLNSRANTLVVAFLGTWLIAG